MARDKSKSKAKLVKKDKSPTTLLTITAVLLAIGIVATLYFVRALRFHGEVFVKKGDVIEQLESNENAIESLQQEFATNEQTGPRSDQVLAALPTSEDFPHTSSTLESIIQRSGVDLESSSLSSQSGFGFGGGGSESSGAYAEANPSVQQSTLSLEVTGSYDSVRRMVDNLEKSLRVFRVESIDLSGSDENMNATLQLTTFYQPAVDNTIDTEELTP